MGAQTGLGDTFDLVNYVGELFHITPSETKFLSMIGGLTGGRSTKSVEFAVGQTVDNATPSQPAISENDAATGASATHRTRSQVTNVTQIHQLAVDISYRKQANVGAISGASILGDQPVQDEYQFQIDLQLKQAARDMNYSALQGTYAGLVNAATATKTRGMKNVITTNTVALGGATAQRAHFQTMFKEMADSGAPFENVVVFANSFNKQVVTDIYGYAPDSRNVGGLDIHTIETDFGIVGVCYERDMPTDEVYAIEMSVCAPVFLEIPGKGHLFVEPLGKAGASEKAQLYGEFGLEYGPELWHGSLTGTATA